MAERDPQIVVAAAGPAAETQRRPHRQRLRKLLLMASVPLLLIGGTLWYYIANDHYVSTDNAYVQQDKVSVSAEVSGPIVAVAVRENQHVRAGDLLFRIDPEPYRIAAAQADAAIATADVKVVGLETDMATKGADIATARANVTFQQEQYNREAALMARGFSTRARIDAARVALATARGQLADAEAAAIKARAALATSRIAPGVNPAVLGAAATRRKAAYDLQRTEVRAPISGIVSKADRLLPGQMMVTGLPAVTIVADAASWIEANFKETDLAHMRVGQPATIEIDAWPDLRLAGHVASIGAGTGSEFSVLPAQNATGNWVKVTQRVPVRIAIDAHPPHPLIAGLSTHVRIDTAK